MVVVFSPIGYIVHPVIDGNIHHYSKRVSIGVRSLQMEMERIIVRKKCSKSLALTSRLSAHINTLSVIERQKLESQRAKLEKTLLSAEKLISYPFPPNFFNNLINELSVTSLLYFNDNTDQIFFKSETYV